MFGCWVRFSRRDVYLTLKSTSSTPNESHVAHTFLGTLGVYFLGGLRTNRWGHHRATRSPKRTHALRAQLAEHLESSRPNSPNNPCMTWAEPRFHNLGTCSSANAGTQGSSVGKHPPFTLKPSAPNPNAHITTRSHTPSPLTPHIRLSRAYSYSTVTRQGVHRYLLHMPLPSKNTCRCRLKTHSAAV